MSLELVFVTFTGIISFMYLSRTWREDLRYVCSESFFFYSFPSSTFNMYNVFYFFRFAIRSVVSASEMVMICLLFSSNDWVLLLNGLWAHEKQCKEMPKPIVRICCSSCKYILKARKKSKWKMDIFWRISSKSTFIPHHPRWMSNYQRRNIIYH